MRKITTSSAPSAIGPYSQAISTGGFVFCSGQLGMDPATGGMVSGGAAEQASQALKNVAAVLAAGGSSLDKVVKTTLFLVDMADFASVNEVYAAAFGTARPARSCVAVAALPRGAKVEIDVIALAQ